jgi:putative transposase
VRGLLRESIKYLFVDGVDFHICMFGSIELVPVLVAIGVTEREHKPVLGMQSGDKESASSRHEFFKELVYEKFTQKS